jgi:lysophospholipase L1-like esterase
MLRLISILACVIALTASAQVTTRSVAVRSGSSTDPDALAWKRNINAAGSTVSATTLAAVSTFVKGCKADNIWSKMLDVGVFAGADLTAALVKLKSLSGTSYTNSGPFVSGDYSETTGLKGNGSSKYLRTGVVPSTMLTLNSTHLAIYDRFVMTTAVGAGGIGAIGARNPSADVLRLYHPYSDRVYYSDAYNASTARVSSAVAAFGPIGFVLASRNGAASNKVYVNAGQIATGTTAAGSLPTVEIYIGAYNNQGSFAEPGSRPFSFASIGEGLSAGEVTSLNTRVHNLQRALNRALKHVVFEGDSRTNGNGAAIPYPTLVGTALGQPPLFVHNFSVSSATISGGSTPANSLTSRAATVNATFSTLLYNADVFMALAGHNDLDQGDSAATAFAEYKAYYQALRTAAPWVKLIAATEPPSTKAGINAKRNAFNTLVRDDPSFYDALCDIGGDPVMGPDAAASDTNLYYDGTHLTQTGQNNIAVLVQAVVQGQL